jgi:glycerol-3-phosphate dehydrogenase
VIRDFTQFQSEEYDLIIVGGGIYGAALCWEAVSCGLKVALFEKSDFGAATSANSLKIIHGGFRYLQSGDINRVKESIREQRVLMRIAPHLVHPLPVLIPIYGHGLRGKESFSIGLKVFEIIRSSEPQLDDPEKHMPTGRMISKSECLELLPSLRREGLNGGVVFFDAQVYNSERLVLEFIKTAWQKGAQPANYTEVIGFIREGHQITGVRVRDVLTGDTLGVSSKLIVLACGPWNQELIEMLGKEDAKPKTKYAKAINIITRKRFDNFAIGVLGRNQYSDGRFIPNAKSNYLFLTPWRNFSILGTAYTMTDKTPSNFEINETDISFLVKEFNEIYPWEKISHRDIIFAHGGLLPLSRRMGKKSGVNLAKKFKILDSREFGYEGLILVEGVKYTTARDVAEKVIGYIFRKWGFEDIPSGTSSSRLCGGEITRFDDYLNQAVKNNSDELGEPQIRSMILNYGSIYSQILDYYHDSSRKDEANHRDFGLLEAEIRYAVEQEMAQKLGDIVFRRTELGSAGDPGADYLRFSAQVMGKELNWDQNRIDQELTEVQNVFTQYN